MFVSRGSNFIDGETFFILYDLLEPRNPDFPYEAYPKFFFLHSFGRKSLLKFPRKNLYLLHSIYWHDYNP